MKLPDLRNSDLTEKKVLLRVDFDVPLKEQESERVEEQEWVVGDETRIRNALPTIDYLLAQNAKIILLSHLGRPEGVVVPNLSLAPVAEKLQELLPQIKVELRFTIYDLRITNEAIILLENLRFNQGEEGNDLKFTQALASLGEFYINDAFAVCHREHASIVGLPKLLPHAAGFSLLREVEVLSSVLENPKRPVVVILGGVKEDKLEAVPGLLNFADKILIGGKLPSIISSFEFLPQSGIPLRGAISSEKVVIGELNQGGKDITLETVEKFGEIIEKAGTIVWAGPMGKYEEDLTSSASWRTSLGAGKWDVGTREIGRAVVESGAFTVIGGGDTEAALTKFGLVGKIDFVSSGGGAMLEFLADGDLPGLAALRHKF